jgi:hypothetical protein
MDTQKFQTKKNTTPVQALLQKEVTRKEFMTTSGLAIVSILGFSTIIHFLSGHNSTSSVIATTGRSGYGTSPYGR